ncbi:MAG TPA: TonB-dependent receptor [Gemmatimonadaceae bacterium]|nr:TonB-dependent receptor [Gemmatimonadaceae bacterium]
MIRFPLSCVRAIPLAFAFIAAMPAYAQDRDTTTLETVIVSATKTPASRSSLTQAVTVLSGDDLRARGIARVADAIREVPGAMIAQNGSLGSVSTLFLRGGESRYTKVLIDGVAVNSSGGFFDLSHLTTDNIERIEIVRGPASVVHGADAMTGAIHIFTRKGAGPLMIDADVRAGTYDTRDAFIGIAGATKGARYSLSGSHHETDGVISFNNQYYNGTLSGSAGFSPRPGSDVSISGRYTTAEFHYPTDFTGAPVDSNAYRVQHRLTAGLDAGFQLSSRMEARVLVGTNDVADLTEDIAIPFGSSTQVHSALSSRGYRRSAEGRLRLALPAGSLNIGAEYARERESSTNAEGAVGAQATPTSTFFAKRSNAALYSELLGTVASIASYTLAARLDDNSDYDAVGTYRAGVSVPVAVGTRLRGSWSTAFNAPAFNQLRPTLYTTGSPDLAPERARSFEIGAEHNLLQGRVIASASYFNQRFTDLIQYVAGGPPSFLGSYDNLARASSNGFDAELRLLDYKGLSGSGSYTHVTPKVTEISSAYSGDLVVGQALLRRPTHSGAARLSLAKPRGTLSATASYVGKRPDLDFAQFPSPVVTLAAYTKFDLGGSVELLGKAATNQSLSLTIRVENAFDRRYEDVLNFPAPGRTLLVGARYRGRL